MRGAEIANLLKGASGGLTKNDSGEESSHSAPPEVGGDPGGIVQAILSRERARESLIDYATFVDDMYSPYPVHRLIASKLEAVEAGKIRRLAIFLPPASGKSRLCSELFPSWFFGRNPTSELIEASYDYDLAAGFGRNVRNFLKHPRYELLFPGVGMSADATAVDQWKTNQGGEYKAEGVGGGLVGFHAHIAILDDPVKNYATASSQRARQGVWDWYTGVLLNRLRPYKGGPGAVVLIMQRWHDDDLGGRIEKLSESGEEHWDILRIPSLAEPGDPLGREEGEALLPDGPNQRSVEELRAIQARNPAMFMALHQQKPVADGGDRFRKGWLQLYGQDALPKKLTYYLCTDYAMSQGSGDYTVLGVAGVCSEGHVWLVDWWRKQCSMLEGVEKSVELVKKWGVSKILLEKTAMAKAYGPLLNKKRQDESLWVVVEDVSIIGRGGKDSEDRAGALAGAMQLGYIHAPMRAGWVGELEYELMRFPNGRHDDQVDALALLAIKLSTLRRAGRAGKEALPGTSEELKPAIWTFGQAVEMNRRVRTGLRFRPRSMVVPGGGVSILDDPNYVPNWNVVTDQPEAVGQN